MTYKSLLCINALRIVFILNVNSQYNNMVQTVLQFRSYAIGTDISIVPISNQSTY